MQIIIQINQVRCIEWGITDREGALFSLLSQATTWAKAIVLDDQVWHWVSRTKVLEELPLSYKKTDTVYRALRKLEEKGLIAYQKEGQKDLIFVTEKGKNWNKKIVENDTENHSEKNPNSGKNLPETRKKIRKSSEKNPKKLGKKSDISDNQLSEADNQINNPTSGCVSHEIARQKIDQTEKDAFTVDDLINDFGISPVNARSWSKVRRTKKSPLTPLSFKRFINQAEKANLSIDAAMEYAATKNWAGFEADWMAKPYGASPVEKGNTFGDNL